MFKQRFSGSIRQEHLSQWKPYWIKPIYLEILYPKIGWITLVKIFREGKPSIRVLTRATPGSSVRELVVLNKLYGKEDHSEQKKKNISELRNKQEHSKNISST